MDQHIAVMCVSSSRSAFNPFFWCAWTAVKYITNLTGAPAAQRAKYSTIRLTNKFFVSNVGCLDGGLLLFTRGIYPRFVLSADATQLSCDLPTQDECLASALQLSAKSAAFVQELADLLGA
jgi:hypothetical protein